MTARPSRPLTTGRAFALSVSPSPGGIRVKLPSALPPLPLPLPAGGAGCGLAFRECSQEDGKEEGKEPSPGSHERNQAAVRAIPLRRTAGFEHLRAQPAPGRLQVGIPIFGVNLGSLEATSASTGSESR